MFSIFFELLDFFLQGEEVRFLNFFRDRECQLSHKNLINIGVFFRDIFDVIVDPKSYSIAVVTVALLNDRVQYFIVLFFNEHLYI